MLLYFIYILNSKIRKKIVEKNPFGADWIRANIAMKKNIVNQDLIKANVAAKKNLAKKIEYNKYKPVPILEKKINQYITLRLEHGRTFIYVNGKRFIQCIRLILNIPKENIPLYDEVDSIDEAAKLYSKHVFQNRIVRGPMAAHVPNQRHNITREQEFWGHCSNIQAWVEHGYDTRILMSNISFPLLRELVKAGDPEARKVFKEEIALRLESGYPSVVQYLLNQGYLSYFNASELKTIIESTEIIKGLSSHPMGLSRFLISCVSKSPSLAEDILIQVLNLSEGKKIILLSMGISETTRIPYFRTNLQYYQYLPNLKEALENLFSRVDEKTVEDILDCIQEIDKIFEEKALKIPDVSRRSYLEAFENIFLNKLPLDELNEELILVLKNKLLQIRRGQSRCSYCGKVIPRGKDICD